MIDCFLNYVSGKEIGKLLIFLKINLSSHR